MQCHVTCAILDVITSNVKVVLIATASSSPLLQLVFVRSNCPCFGIIQIFVLFSACLFIVVCDVEIRQNYSFSTRWYLALFNCRRRLGIHNTLVFHDVQVQNLVLKSLFYKISFLTGSQKGLPSYYLPLNVFTASKGSKLYISIDQNHIQ